MVWLPDGEKRIDDMFSRFDIILACDRQTDGQTSYDGIVRAVHNASRGKNDGRQTELR